MNWLTAADNTRLSETAKYGYIPGLDGIRAIAVLIVLVAHMGFEHIVPGGFGVTIFFFISGFLITRLLLAESESKGQIGLKNFYLRRFVRLYPALLFMIFGSMLLFAVLGFGGPPAIQLGAAIFYFTNFLHVSLEVFNNPDPFMPWTHLWSLAVEEHFYLIFPLFMVLCRRNWKRAASLLALLLILAPLWRSFIYFGTSIPSGNYLYMMTDARIDSLVWGCFLSVLLHLNGNLKPFKWLLGIGPLTLGLLVILASFVIRDESFRNTIRFSAQGAAIFVLILNFYYLKSVRFAIWICETKPLAWIGKISYALYLWHVPIYVLIHYYMERGALSIALAVSLSFIISAISFYWVEKPFIGLRKRFGAHIIARS